MDALLKKLNLTNQQHALLVNVPAELATLMTAFSERMSVSQQPESLEKADFVMGFVQQLAQVEQLAAWTATHTEGDTVVWMVYPKQSSKKYRCEFNRDTGWASLGKAGFEPVRMVAVNDDWSALRFRRAAFIKTMTRDQKHMLSEEARSRTSQPANQ
ncbi:hypothetical protein [Fibrella forsythiae]|uniref:DUF3052 domain-containing protein n=1 Tax=Fibrella forsythiae TaxID=2817061 RepID=A0ABS3JRS1_9BACT|nr:hypothetical protein [Fibrella forsythiae]MBO0952707.1 hypothetical protein [Fibrella forsythiae]